MMYRSFNCNPLLVVLVIIAFTATAFGQTPKKRIAVLDFDFDAVQKWWEGEWNVGAGISEILVNGFFDDGTYQLVDRNAIEQILNEQDFSRSARVDPNSAARLGKLLGADALLVGSITQFGTEKQSTGGLGGLIGKETGILGSIGVQQDKAKCVIDARLIDVNTGVIVAVAEGVGVSSRKGLLLGAAGRDGFSAGTGAFQMTSSNFRETILGEATNAACREVVAKIVASQSRIQKAKVEISGLVADYDVAANEVTMTPGEEAGVAIGQTFIVHRITGVVKHPTTGKVIREKSLDVCRLKVIEAGDGYAVATLVEPGEPQPGDKVVIVHDN